MMVTMGVAPASRFAIAVTGVPGVTMSLEIEQPGDEVWHAVEVAPCVAILDQQVATLYVAESPEALPNPSDLFRIGAWGARRYVADARHRARRLRVGNGCRNEKQNGRDADEPNDRRAETGTPAGKRAHQGKMIRTVRRIVITVARVIGLPNV